VAVDTLPVRERSIGSALLVLRRKYGFTKVPSFLSRLWTPLQSQLTLQQRIDVLLGFLYSGLATPEVATPV
jgi:hypothetical protein